MRIKHRGHGLRHVRGVLFGQNIGDFAVLDGHAEAADVKDARFAGVNKPYNVCLFGEDDGSVRPQKLP